MEWVKLPTFLGIFILTFASTSFQTLSQRSSSIDVPETLFFILKHLGTGVILSTAFVHLLQDAFETLFELEKSRMHGIQHWIGLILLASLLSIFLVEYISLAYVESLEQSGRPVIEEGHHHEHRHDELSGDSAVREILPHPGKNDGIPPHLPTDTDGVHTSDVTRLSRQREPLSERTFLLPSESSSSGTPDEHQHYSATFPFHGDGGLYRSRLGFLRRKVHHHQEPSYLSRGRCEPGTCREEGCAQSESEGSPVGRTHAIVKVLVLQAGIMIHSLIIGVTLSIKKGPEFTSLVIAISFHQLFEGFSLGARLATLAHPSESTKSISIPIILSTIFALSLPAGCLIGHFTLDSISDTREWNFKLAQGLTSAVSAGTLIYASCVELLAGDFIHSSLRREHIWKQLLAFGSLFTGTAVMALLAALD